jgi:EAL domain-containing protein (putative c-di-GMP-specific phosphodiesterase class I)
MRHEDRTTTGMWGVFELRSAFQPIFGFHDGKLAVDAFEGLIRPSRNGDPVSPAHFFQSLAADDRLPVETLTRTLHLLNAGEFLDPKTMLFVNLDPSVLGRRRASEEALRATRLVLDEAGIEPARVVCEITEQRSASRVALADFVSALRGHGFRIAVDDYGAEESGMERVTALKPDIVKFDARWVARLMHSSPGFALLTTMVKEFASRGIRTVLEGIEEGRQLALAEEAGADMVQGYALAEPQTAPTGFALFGRDAARPPRRHGNPASLPPGIRAAGAPSLPDMAASFRIRRHAAGRTFGRRIAS